MSFGPSRGIAPDGAQVTVIIGTTEIRTTAFEPGGETIDGIEYVYELGNQEPVAMTSGTVKPSDIKITFRYTVWASQILPYLPKKGMTNARTVISVSVEHPDIGDDGSSWTGARLTGYVTKYEVGGKAIAVETTWMYLHQLEGENRQRIGGDNRSLIEGRMRL